MSNFKGQMSKLLIICGPTATGKTKLALDLAHQLNGELISTDSRQVYKNFDALTGKDRSEAGSTPIWMYDVIDVGSDFSVSQYAHMAQHIIDDIQKRGKLPIAVGGTGLYLKALTQALPLIHVPPNINLRQKFQNQPKEVLQKELQKRDGEKWKQMNQSDKNNPRRLIRALEIAQSGITPHDSTHSSDVLWIGLTAAQDILEKRISNRIEERWEKATSEVKSLGQRSLPILGFLEIQQYLAGTLTKEEAMRQWITKERQYAKRQFTWFKKQSAIHWLDITSPRFHEDALALATSWYTGHT